MKIIKAFVFTVLATGSVACGSALAQDSTNAPVPPPPAMSTNRPPRPPMIFRGGSVDRLAQILNLTDAQKTQVQPIFDAEHQKMRDIRDDNSLSIAEKRAKMQETRDATTAQLQPILTQEQFTKWQNMTHPRRPGRPPTPPPVSTNTPSGSAP
jgi:Spy/CpxP family protein refolding chaperone